LARGSRPGQLGFDFAVQVGDVGAGLIDAGEHGFEQEGVMVAEAADEGLLQQTPLGA
jgi:hypothetical protein